jgi:aminoglycoside phosphotransferase (APT) family kinase protein
MGFGSIIHETADGYIRREARTPQIREAFARQLQFLPWLAQILPVAVPVPESLLDNVLLYRRLPGEIVTPAWMAAHAEGLARDVACFITALHSIPICDGMARGMSTPNRTEELLLCFEATLPLLSQEDQRAALAWRDAFSGHDRGSAIVHGDLWYGNLLADAGTGKLCGVLDFDSAGVGDPAWDLAAQFHTGTEFARRVFDAYPYRSAELWSRAEELFQLRQFEGLAWSVHHRDTAEFEESIGKLRAVGVLPAVPRKF